MTIKDTLKKYQNIETEILLGHVLKKSKEFLYTHPEKKLTALELKKFKTLTKRRLKGEPIAYILGYKDFYGLRFKVNKNVLIPRPETEWLVEKALIQKNKNRILDIGTGSGCIAIAIKKHSKTSKVTASDISFKALAVAKANARNQTVKIKFIKSNLFSNLKGKFDMIIANLPYVPTSDYKKLKSNLKYEPKLAITDGTNTAEIYKRFLKDVKNHLSPKGLVLLEIDPSTKKYLPKQALIYKDIAGLPRYAEIIF